MITVVSDNERASALSDDDSETDSETDSESDRETDEDAGTRRPERTEAAERVKPVRRLRSSFGRSVSAASS